MRRIILSLIFIMACTSAHASTFAPVYTGTVSNLSATVTNSSTQIIAASGTRKYLLLQNVSSTNFGCNPFGGTASIGTAGTFTIPPNGSLVFESSVIAQNAWNCITASSTGGLSVMAIQ